MLALDPQIRDQAYQFFIKEAQGRIATLEAGLVNLHQNDEWDKVHDEIHGLVQAAHSIRQGAARIGLADISEIAQQLETVLRAIYHREILVDLDLEMLLLPVCETLKVTLLEEMSTGQHQGKIALQELQQTLVQLKLHLGDVLSADDRAPTTIELGIDLIHSVFTREVSKALERLEWILAHPETGDFKEAIEIQVECLIGVGGLVNLPGFLSIAQTTKSALQRHPDQILPIAILAYGDFCQAQVTVLDGDRTEGGRPSAELLAWDLDLASDLDPSIDEEIAELLATASVIEKTESLDFADNSFDELEAFLSATPDQALLDRHLMPISGLDGAQTLINAVLTEEFESDAINNSVKLTSPPVVLTQERTLNHKLIQRLTPTPSANAAYVSGAIRVDLTLLQRINNLVGELFTQENGAVLDVQQLRSVARSVMQRFSHFEQIARDLQDLADHNHNTRAQIQTTQTHRKQSVGLHGDFDPLQMDSYDRLHLLMQEVAEQLAHLGEAMQDVGLVTRHIEQAQRQRQNTLKQVRTDLLRARMLPVMDVVHHFPRMVRDLSTKYHKQVTVKLTGTDTLVDKVVLEKLFDPLVHLVRNAFDHGIESATQRQTRNKPAQATIEIRAYHRGNQTYIEVRDDGQGIDSQAIRKKAIALNLFTAREAQKLSNEQLYELLFTPGFSTAAQVTELSGRGVGLDAVRQQISHLKGSITLHSQTGNGTIFTLRFPLTLSIAKLVVFNIQSDLMAIPSDSLDSIVMVSETDIHTVDGRQYCQLSDDRSVPIYPEAILLDHYPSFRNAPPQAQALALPQAGRVPLILVSGTTETMALRVDQILQEQEYVIKPFGKAIAPPIYLYGCTVLGNGVLVPVLDGQGLLTHQALIDSSNGADRGDNLEGELADSQPENIPVILVVDDSLTARQFLAVTLEKANYRVIQAKDGREALQQLQQSAPITAIFCDIEMPCMNGFEFLSAYHQEFSDRHLPVIMLTSRSSEKHRQIAHKLGAKGYLTKPYLEQELLATLSSVLSIDKG